MLECQLQDIKSILKMNMSNNKERRLIAVGEEKEI